MQWCLYSLVLFHCIALQNIIIGNAENRIISFGMKFRPYFYAELVPSIDSIQITAEAKFNDALRTMRLGIAGDLTDYVSITYDINDGTAKTSGYEVYDNRVYVHKKNFPELFAALADFNTWSAGFYYRYTFDWDRVEKKQHMGRYSWNMTYFEMHKENTKNKPIDKNIEQQLYRIYQMVIVIIQVERSININIADNKYKSQFFEWDVFPQGNVLPYNKELHLAYPPNTSFKELTKRVLSKIELTHEAIKTSDTPQEFTLNEYAVTVTHNGRALSDDAIMPNLKNNKNSGYALEIKQSLLYYAKDPTQGSITLKYTNPSDAWLKNTRVGKFELVMRTLSNKNDQGLSIMLKAWDRDGKVLSDLKDPAVLTEDDIKTNWKELYPGRVYEALIERLELTPEVSEVNNTVWYERNYIYTLEELCWRIIQIYAAKKNVPLMLNGYPQRKQPKTQWISNNMLTLGLGLGALAYVYSSHKR